MGIDKVIELFKDNYEAQKKKTWRDLCKMKARGELNKCIIIFTDEDDYATVMAWGVDKWSAPTLALQGLRVMNDHCWPRPEEED